MKTKMKSTQCVFLLILALVGALYCQGCRNNEREALLSLGAQFDPPLPWVEGTDCCQWEGVECNSTTRRVAELDLSATERELSVAYRYKYWYLNYTDFLVFEDLKSLNLSFNNIAECVENEGQSISYKFYILIITLRHVIESDMICLILTSLYLCTLQG